MDVEVPESLESEEQFWEGNSRALKSIDPSLTCFTELDKIVAAPFETHEHIDDALRSFLAFTTANKRMLYTSTKKHCYRRG